jgi:H3 lysine-79-specific histone-lysine N-methyltransferase
MQGHGTWSRREDPCLTLQWRRTGERRSGHDFDDCACDPAPYWLTAAAASTTLPSLIRVSACLTYTLLAAAAARLPAYPLSLDFLLALPPAMFMNPNKPKIRTKTVTVKKAPAPPPHTPAASHTRPAQPVKSRSFSGPPANRYQVTTSAQPTKAREPARRSLAVSQVQKRKVSPSTPQWASSDDESEEEDDRAKRRKTRPGSNSSEPMSLNRTLEPDLGRRIRIQSPETNGITKGTADIKLENGTATDKKPAKRRGSLIHGLTMSRGDEAKNYRAAFTGCSQIPVLELQYPSLTRPEKFEAANPLDAQEGYSPLEDIYFCIEEIIQHYLPADLAAELSSDTEGTVRLLKRAVSKNSPSDFDSELDKFNTLIRARVSDGTIPRIMDDMHALPLSLVKRITAQSYNRIVSPQAHRLRKVKGKETTYGELLTPFVHKIFQQTSLKSHHIFVDLGSGVGNVVLQAALQTGAESWGIEKMPLAASLGSKQASELQARAKLWNIDLGAIHLLAGDFLDTPAIDAVLRRADVVLVNNKVFGETLNNALLQKFLDLKDGCKVVSLESFGGGAKQGVRHEQAIAGLFDEERFESGTASVSWVGESVEYYIATKAR